MGKRGGAEGANGAVQIAKVSSESGIPQAGVVTKHDKKYRLAIGREQSVVNIAPTAVPLIVLCFFRIESPNFANGLSCPRVPYVRHNAPRTKRKQHGGVRRKRDVGAEIGTDSQSGDQIASVCIPQSGEPVFVRGGNTGAVRRKSYFYSRTGIGVTRQIESWLAAHIPDPCRPIHAAGNDAIAVV